MGILYHKAFSIAIFLKGIFVKNCKKNIPATMGVAIRDYHNSQ